MFDILLSTATIKTMISYCAPGVTKELQKDWNWIRYQIGGKMFAAISLDDILMDLLEKAYRIVLESLSKKSKRILRLRGSAVGRLLVDGRQGRY